MESKVIAWTYAWIESSFPWAILKNPARRCEAKREPASQNRSKLRTFASGASASGLQYNGSRETLDVLAIFAFPSHGMLLLRRSDLV